MLRTRVHSRNSAGDNCAFEVHLESDQFGETERYILRDIPANFEVRTNEREVKENCKPLS